jgi:hypothetical protein
MVTPYLSLAVSLVSTPTLITPKHGLTVKAKAQIVKANVSWDADHILFFLSWGGTGRHNV